MNVDLALDMLHHGFSLVPVHTVKNSKCTCGKLNCQSVAKHPYPSRWQEVCSSRPDDIKAWSRAFREPNWGVVTGKASGVVVLDIDPRHGGMDSLDNLMVQYGKLPETATVETGGGGFHYYFRDPGGLKNGANIGGRGIDFRGDSGFVVGAGSKHASGGVYDWYDEQTPDVGFAPLPRWIYDLVYKPPIKASEIVREGSTVAEGSRNVWLTSLAGALRNRGCGYNPILACLIEANKELCRPPLIDEEILIIARSISKYQINGGRVL